MKTRRRRDAGMIGFLAVMLLLIVGGGVASIYLLPQQIDAVRERLTRERLIEVHAASLRFADDIGRMPATLSELIVRGGLPAATTATTQGVLMGWAGPYVRNGFDPGSRLNDAWGRPLLYATAGGLLAGQIGSLGRDGQGGTIDDLRYPAAANTATGTLRVDLYLWNRTTQVYDANPPYASDTAQSTTVTVYYPVNGVETAASLTTASALPPPFTWSSVPVGRHAVFVTTAYKSSNPPMTASATAETLGNGRADRITIYVGGSATANQSVTCDSKTHCACMPNTSCSQSCGVNATGDTCTLSCLQASTCNLSCDNKCTYVGPTQPGTSMNGACDRDCTASCGAASSCNMTCTRDCTVNGSTTPGSALNVTCDRDCDVSCAASGSCNTTCARDCTVEGPTTAGGTVSVDCDKDCAVNCRLAATCYVHANENKGDIDCGSASTCTAVCDGSCTINCRTSSCSLTCTSNTKMSCGGTRFGCGKC